MSRPFDAILFFFVLGLLCSTSKILNYARGKNAFTNDRSQRVNEILTLVSNKPLFSMFMSFFQQDTQSNNTVMTLNRTSHKEKLI